MKKSKAVKKVNKVSAKGARLPVGQGSASGGNRVNVKPESSEDRESIRPVLKYSSSRTPQLVRGFKDLLPVDQKYWDKIRRMFESFSNAYSFDRIDPPIVEEVGLFARAVGSDNEVVTKQMFVFEDYSGDQLVLRPEATASIGRAYVNHGMINLPQPVKLAYMGPMFRYERPQAGRYRQFYQLGFEAMGDNSPVIDAQMIAMAHNFLNELGIKSVAQINSLGTPADRKLYKQKLVAYYKSQKKYLPEHELINLQKNPLRLLDSKDEKMLAIREDAPQILDFLSEESKNHLMKVIEYLDELEVKYEVNPFLVRGLDYYTHTVFEMWVADDPNAGQMALGGGGRYDGLIELIGGRPTPSAGFALGIDRLVMKMRELYPEMIPSFVPKILVAQLGDASRRKAMVMFEKMRQDGLPVVEAFSKNNLKTQLDIANKLNVKYTLIIGQKELTEGTVLIRDMEGGVQETIPYTKIFREMKKRFGLEE